MADATSGEHLRTGLEAQHGEAGADARDDAEAVAVRQLRGAVEYRGRREALLASGEIHADWLPPERMPGQRMRATLRARDGGRDVFVRRLDDGRYCVLVIQTPTERAEHERTAFARFMEEVMRRSA